VCYLALVLSDERERHKQLVDALQEYRKEPWCRHAAFRMNVLPPLGKVAEQDLFDFLEDPDNSSCPANIHTEIAERLIQRTGGRFDDTVKLMEQAEQGSWYDLLEQLQREQGVTTIADDEPF
jgi:hypothetical protein